MARPRMTTLLTITGLLLVGCSAGGTSAPAADAPSPTPPTAIASAACDDFDNALERTATQFAYLKVAVGSDLDESERLATLQDYTGTLADDAATCAPEAAASLATLRDEAVALAEAYVPKADGAVAEGINAILVDIRAAGEQAWTEMGMAIETWQYLPINEDGSTIE